jgi:serine/threonine-protein kinase
MEPGSRLGPYEIVAPLGAGGMGEVYRARDTRLGREVAIKVLPPELAADPERVRRFEVEARAVAALSHPSILALFDVGSQDGAPYLVTELLEGEDLGARLRTGPLPVPRAAAIAVQVARGLAAVHEKGIIHRDLKPTNIFLTGNGSAKILDFGIAKLVPPGNTDEVARAATLVEATEAGALLGTVAYMSPEQARGQTVDHRSDVFALGCVLYEMLGGTRPFTGETAADILAAVLSSHPCHLVERRPEVPPGLDAVVRRCLAKRPDDRFGSARELAAALEPFARERPAPAACLGGGAAHGDRPAIAVLPFANLSADPEQEYFCAGMAEEILNALAHIQGLRVIARTSAFAFKGRSQDIRAIGAALSVGFVLEGSVRKAGDRLRITAQLIDVADGSHLWSERYDRRMEDVFAIQEEIALAIVAALKVRLLGHERAAIERRPTGDLDAHSAYLRGQFYWNTFTPEGFARSRESFEEAVRIDPGFALAHGGLGMWYVSQAFWADYSAQEAWMKASAMVERALAGDPESWLAHTLRGNLLAFFERRWPEAEESLRRGALLGPGQAAAHFNLAAFLVVRRCWAEAADEARVSLRLDPLSPPNCAWGAMWLNLAGHRDEAVAELAKIMEVAPSHWLPHWVAGHLAARSSRLGDARAACEKAVTLSGRASMAVALLACVCLATGDARRADELEAELLARAPGGSVASTPLAWIANARGDVHAAVRRIGDAAAARDPLLCFFRSMPAALQSGDPKVEAALAGLDL